VKRIRSLTGDEVDAVFDPIGRATQILRSYRALRKGGRLIWFGMRATKEKGMPVIPLTTLVLGLLKLISDGKEAPLTPDLGTFARGHTDWYRETLTKLLNSLAAGRINPAVEACVPLAGAARAHQLLERGGYAGKSVLVAGR
jgi:NADPH2:quinone reductase